jgi:hypothetical protein
LKANVRKGVGFFGCLQIGENHSFCGKHPPVPLQLHCCGTSFVTLRFFPNNKYFIKRFVTSISAFYFSQEQTSEP